MNITDEFELKLKKNPSGGAFFYISQTLIKYNILEINKTYKIKIIEEVKT